MGVKGIMQQRTIMRGKLPGVDRAGETRFAASCRKPSTKWSEDQAEKKLDDLTDEELRTLVDETLDRQQMIKTLKEHFKYEENHDKAK